MLEPVPCWPVASQAGWKHGTPSGLTTEWRAISRKNPSGRLPRGETVAACRRCPGRYMVLSRTAVHPLPSTHIARNSFCPRSLRRTGPMRLDDFEKSEGGGGILMPKKSPRFLDYNRLVLAIARRNAEAIEACPQTRGDCLADLISAHDVV